MPILRIIKKNNLQIGIWNITERLSQFIKLSKIEHIPKFKKKERIKEFLACRLLLNEIAPNTLITYNKYGAPEINTDDFISISHSNNMSAIIISKKKVGLDVEKISEKALKLSSKFMLKDLHTPVSKEKATLIWCCKEAIYKWEQKGGINFISDIKIMPFKIKSYGTINAILRNKKLTLNYEKVNTHFLVYICK